MVINGSPYTFQYLKVFFLLNLGTIFRPYKYFTECNNTERVSTNNLSLMWHSKDCKVRIEGLGETGSGYLVPCCEMINLRVVMLNTFP